VNSNEGIGLHLEAGNNFDASMNQARISSTIDCWQEDSEQILTEIVKDLSHQKVNLNMPADTPWAYRQGKKGIEAGEAAHTVDKVVRVCRLREWFRWHISIVMYSPLGSIRPQNPYSDRPQGWRGDERRRSGSPSP
jgi:hypothetical protein